MPSRLSFLNGLSSNPYKNFREYPEQANKEYCHHAHKPVNKADPERETCKHGRLQGRPFTLPHNKVQMLPA